MPGPDPSLEPPAVRSLGPDPARNSLDDLAQVARTTTQAVSALGSGVKSTLQVLQGAYAGMSAPRNNQYSTGQWSGSNNGGNPTFGGRPAGGSGNGGGFGGFSGGSEGLQDNNPSQPTQPYNQSRAYQIGGAIAAANYVGGVNNGTLSNWANMRTQFGGMSTSQVGSLAGLGSANAATLSSLFARTGWAPGSSPAGNLMRSTAGSALLTGVSAQQAAVNTTSMFSAQSINQMRMMGLGDYNSMRLSGQNPVTSLANQLIQKSNAKAKGNKLTAQSVQWLAYASDSPIVQNLNIMVMQGALDPSSVEQVQAEVYNQLMTFAKSGLSFSKYSSLEKTAAGQGSKARAAQNMLYKSGATSVGKADLLNQQIAASQESRQIGASGAYLNGLSDSAKLIGDFNSAMGSLLNGPLGALVGYAGGMSEVARVGSALGGVAKTGTRAIGGIFKWGETLFAGASGGAAADVAWGGYSEAGAVAEALAGSALSFGLGGASEYAGSYSAGTGATSAPTTSGASPSADIPMGASASQKAIVNAAKKYLGVPYLWGGTDPSKGLDCSGLVQRAYADCGIKLPRVSGDQAKVGTPVASIRDAQPGDIVAFGNPVHHVGIYVGNNMIINAPHTGTVVRIENVSDFDGIAAIRRVVQSSSSSGGRKGASRQGSMPKSMSSSTASGPTSTASNQAIVKQVAASYGWNKGAEWTALNDIVMSESGYRNTAQNPKSTAYGMFQFLDNTWAGYGAQKTSDPTAQAIAGLSYIAKRYGDPIAAWDFHKKRGWYDKGSWELKSDEDARVHKGEMIIPAEPAEKLREKFDQLTDGKGAGHAAKSGGVNIVFKEGSISLVVGAGATPGQGRALAHEFAYTLGTDERIKAMMNGGNR